MGSNPTLGHFCPVSCGPPILCVCLFTEMHNVQISAGIIHGIFWRFLRGSATRVCRPFFIEMHSIQIDAGFIHGFSGVFTEALPFVLSQVRFVSRTTFPGSIFPLSPRCTVYKSVPGLFTASLGFSQRRSSSLSLHLWLFCPQNTIFVPSISAVYKLR